MEVVKPVIGSVVKSVVIVNTIGKGGGSSGPNWSLRTPGNLIGQGISTTEILLNWYDGIFPVDGINIYKSTNNVTFVIDGTANFGDLTYTVSSLTEGVTYYFKIAAFIGSNISPFSNTITTYTKVAPLITGWTFDNPIGADYFANDLAEIAISNVHTQSGWFFENKTYLVYAANGDDPYIKYYDHSTNLWSAAVKIGTNPLVDDEGHGEPSMLIDQDGYIHVMWGAHNTNIQYAISTNRADISSWTVRSSPDTGTYPQLMQFTDGTIYMFYRRSPSPNQDWVFKTSVDNGVSWSSFTRILYDYAYCKFVQGANDVVHVSINGNNTTGFDRFNAYYICFTGGVWKNGAGITLTLPLHLTDSADIIVRNSGTNYIPMTAVGFDSSNNPFVFYTEGIAANEISTYNYKLAKFISGSWTIYNMGVATDRFQDYITAVEVVSTSVINAYLIHSGPTSNYIGGYVEHWQSTDGGENWAEIIEVIHYNCIMPMIIKNYNTKAKLFIPRHKAQSGYSSNEGYLWGDEGFIKNYAIPLGVHDIKLLYPGTLTGVPLPTLIPGQFGNGISIVRANSQYMEIADNDVFSFGQGVAPDAPFSISMWVNFTDTTTNQYLFCKGYASNREYECNILTNVLSFNIKIKAGTSDLKATVSFTTTGVLTFFTFTYDGSGTKEGVKIFINTVESQTAQVKTGTYTYMTNSGGKLFLGAYGTPVNYITATIDEFKVWNRVLTPAEMVLIMNNDPAW